MATTEGLLQTLMVMRQQGQLHPLVKSAIQANAQMQSNKAADRASKAAAQAEGRTKVTFNPDGTVDIKAAPMHDGDAAVQEATAKPFMAVQEALGQSGQTAEILRQLGLELDDVDEGMGDGLSFGETYRATRKDLGEDPLRSAIHGLLVRTGLKPQERAQQEIRQARGSRNLAKLKAVYPVLNQAQDIQNRTEADEKQRQTEGRMRRANVRSVINDLDIEALTPENVAALSGVEELTSAEIAALGGRRVALEGKTEDQRQKAIASRITGMKDEDVAGYEKYEDWLRDQEAELGEWDLAAKGRSRARFRGLQKELTRKQRDQEMQEARFERAIQGVSETNASSRWSDADLINPETPVKEPTRRVELKRRIEDSQKEITKLNDEQRKLGDEKARLERRLKIVAQQAEIPDYRGLKAQDELVRLESRLAEIADRQGQINDLGKRWLDRMQTLGAPLGMAPKARARTSDTSQRMQPDKSGKYPAEIEDLISTTLQNAPDGTTREQVIAALRRRGAAI